MAPPLISTITLIAELIIASLIFFIIYKGYRHGRIPFGLAYFAIAYEVVFNIGYMLYRFLQAAPSSLSKGLVALAIFHGTLSLVVFIFAVVFLTLSIIKYKKRVNFFKKNKCVTYSFVILWIIALISGIIIYFMAYS